MAKIHPGIKAAPPACGVWRKKGEREAAFETMSSDEHDDAEEEEEERRRKSSNEHTTMASGVTR